MFNEGQQIGPYTLIRRLGRGGFGDVWLAERRSQFLTKRVAVKLPHDDQIDFNTIQREAGLWEEASGHPNVLPIIDAEVYEGQVVIVSEYADGGSLADKLKDVGTTTVKEAVDLTMGILNGLEFLHDKRIIHRDIKPQNILLQGNTPRLADFGISRAMATSGVSSTVIGTDAYMSPEAFDGKRTVQTDIWSTGVVLYQLLNGTLPFPQTHPTERMFAVLTKDFEPLDDSIPADLRQIVTTALAKLPENRFKSAPAMREALGHAKVRIDHPTLAHTEVFDRSSIPILAPSFADAATEADPEATVIRVQIPTEQETFVRPAAPETPASTQLAFSDIPKPPEQTPWGFLNDEKKPEPFPSLSTKPVFGIEKVKSFLEENPLGGIIGVGALIIGGFFLLLSFYALVPSSSSNKFSSNNSTNRSSTSINAVTNTNARVTNANSYSPINSNGGGGIGSGTGNGSNTNMANTNAFGSKTPFCTGYVEAYRKGYTDVTHETYPFSEPSCPSEKDQKYSSYESGKTWGYSEGITAAKATRSSNK